jgi:asparagine synthetase B (glutamine-hydrolysing)
VVLQVELPCDASSSSSSTSTAACCLSLHMAASLLQLRGSSPSTSPLSDAQGNTLCFNGEVFSGLDIPQGGNDGKALLAALQQAPVQSASSAAAGGSVCEGVVGVLSKLRGPWALIYWQAQQQTLWFGRDVMGRQLWLFCASTATAQQACTAAVS